MKKEIYEKPDIELISLLNVDIITTSEEGGDVDEPDDEFTPNSMENDQVDESPWTRDSESHGRSFFDELIDAIEEYNQENGSSSDVPTDETPFEEAPVDNASNDIPVDENIDN